MGMGMDHWEWEGMGLKDIPAQLKCNGTQGNAVPPPPILAQSVPPPQIVIMLGKGT